MNHCLKSKCLIGASRDNQADIFNSIGINCLKKFILMNKSEIKRKKSPKNKECYNK